MFVYDVDGDRGHVVNPVLTALEGRQDGPEGCLSVPGARADTPRARTAVVEGQDRDGNPVTVTGHGLLARCLQHETDHLAGRLYLDRLPVDRRREVLRRWRDQPTR